MSALVDVILKAGILSPDSLAEVKRWGLPVGDPDVADVEYAAAPSPEMLARSIADAIEGEGYVLTRETDLEAIPQYLQSMRPGVLRVTMEDGEKAEFEVQVGQTKTGEWIMPWHAESITDLLTNGETYLRVDGRRVYFSQARELFYGLRKAFIICTPSTTEAGDGVSG